MLAYDIQFCFTRFKSGTDSTFSSTLYCSSRCWGHTGWHNMPISVCLVSADTSWQRVHVQQWTRVWLKHAQLFYSTRWHSCIRHQCCACIVWKCWGRHQWKKWKNEIIVFLIFVLGDLKTLYLVFCISQPRTKPNV